MHNLERSRIHYNNTSHGLTKLTPPSHHLCPFPRPLRRWFCSFQAHFDQLQKPCAGVLRILDGGVLWYLYIDVAPWCGHCKKAAPEYLQAAEILAGIVNFGAVDMTTDQSAGAPYNVQGYPTIKLFAGDKANPIDFNSGDRTFDKFVDFCMSHLKKEVTQRKKKLEEPDSGEEL